MNRKKAFCLVLFVSGILSAGGFSGADMKITPRLEAWMAAHPPPETLPVWVYFDGKGPEKKRRLEEELALLPEPCLRRRLRNGFTRLVDEYDLPVHRPYLNAVRSQAARVRHVSRWLNAVSVEVDAEAIRSLASLPFVRRVDRVVRYAFREPVSREGKALPQRPEVEAAHVFSYGSSLAQLDQINVPPLHDLGYSGRGILICMLDAGFNNLEHKALAHLDIRATWDFVNGDPDVFDQDGQMGNGDHGTNTLAAIAGFAPGELIGPAFGAGFILGKTENTEWERHVEEDHWIAGAEWAEHLGADIISSSLGYRDRFTHGERDYAWEDMDGETTAVVRAANIAAARGILIVNSAGNEGSSTPPENTLVSPSDSPYVLAAGAVDGRGERVFFSSTGPTADGRIKPDLMARGLDVYTARPDDPRGYTFVDGTSFSCPLTAGAAALVLEVNPAWTNADVMEAMKRTASRSDDPDNRFGWGILNAYQAAFYPLKNIHAPRRFSVRRLENHYGFFLQYVDELSWEPDPRNGDRTAAYRIQARRLLFPGAEFQPVAEVDGQTFTYTRRGLLEEEEFLYRITAVSKTGEESDPAYARR